MRFIRSFLAIFVVALAFGCGQEGPIIGGKTNPAPVKEVVSLSPSTTEIIGAKLFGPKIIGRTASCNWPPGPAITKSEIVMNGTKPNYEKITSLRPDLVVYDASLFSPQDIQKLEDLKIRTFGITADTIEDFCVQLYKLGTITGTETKANDYVTAIRAAVEHGRAAVSEVRPKTCILMPGDGSEHYIAGTESFQADEIRQSGGEPVGPKGKAYMPVNIEELISINPDVIITVGDPTPVLKDTRLKGISALKNGRVTGISGDFLTRRGARVDMVINTMVPLMRKQSTK